MRAPLEGAEFLELSREVPILESDEGGAPEAKIAIAVGKVAFFAVELVGFFAVGGDASESVLGGMPGEGGDVRGDLRDRIFGESVGDGAHLGTREIVGGGAAHIGAEFFNLGDDVPIGKRRDRGRFEFEVSFASRAVAVRADGVEEEGARGFRGSIGSHFALTQPLQRDPGEEAEDEGDEKDAGGAGSHWRNWTNGF